MTSDELKDLNDRYRETAFHTKIVGVTMQPDRQTNIAALKNPDKLYPVFEDNKFDPNAIRLYADEEQTKDLGYIRKEIAKDLRLFKKHGIEFEVRVTDVTGGTGNKSHGCNILVILKR